MARRPGQWQDEEEPLQAIILADSFNQRFVPLTAHEPRTLLPLLNTPLLDYTLEFLTAAGVQDIVIFCCAHAAKIQAHVAQSKWAKIIRSIVSQKCMSVGDALREIDQTGHIRHNFVLVTGDIVSNYKLGVLQDHIKRLKTDKDAVMTMLFKCAKPGHPLRSAEDNVVACIDKESGRLLAFDNSGRSSVRFPLSVFRDRASAQVRADLINCHIFICAPQLLMLFADNFDYQTIEDFITGTLAADELEQFKIHTHILTHEYAARVCNLYSYQAITKDILNRWSYPLVPDNFPSSSSSGGRALTTRYTHNHVYLEDGVILSRACKILCNVLIGGNTRVGRDGANVTTMSGSVIGRGCTIGAGVRLTNAYVWGDTIIGDDCVIENSLLASGVRLGPRVTVGAGSVVGHGVFVPEDTKIPPGSRLALERPAGAQVQTVDGRFYYWPLHRDDPDLKFKLWDRPEEEPIEPEEESESEEELMGETRDDFSGHLDDIRDFVASRVQPGKQLSQDLKDNIILEIKGSKHAHHMTLEDTVRAIALAIVHEIDDSKDALKKMVLAMMPVLANFTTTNECRTELLGAFEEGVQTKPAAIAGLQSAINALYEADVLVETTIITWFNQADTSPAKPAIRKAVQPLVTWLQTADEESSSEESDDD